jgi:hypothetical protein
MMPETLLQLQTRFMATAQGTCAAGHNIPAMMNRNIMMFKLMSKPLVEKCRIRNQGACPVSPTG